MAPNRSAFRPRRALFPALYYGANAIYQGYISLFYTQLGFSRAQLGLLSSANAASALVFAPLWGSLGDRSRNRRALLALLSLAAALSFPLKLMGGGFAWQIFAAALFYAFFSALLPLGDSLLLQGEGDSFGAYRLAGGISFALASLFFGLLRGKGGGSGLWMVSLLLFLAAAAAFLLPAAGEKGPGRRSGMAALLKNGRLMLLLGLSLPLQMSMSYFYTYFAPHFVQLGGSSALLGLGYLLCTAGEIPYLIFSGRIHRRWGAEAPMCIAAALMALRWLLLGLSRSPVIALLSQLLHGGGFIVISVSMALWIRDHVPGELQASGQSLLNLVSFGLGRIGGNLLGACIAQRWGMAAGFIAGAVLCIFSGCALALLRIRRR